MSLSKLEPKNNDYNALRKAQESYNRPFIALEYADYCLEYVRRYNFEKNKDRI